MSFVVWAALALAAFVAAPVVAHLLRRGRAKEHEFPSAALVPALVSTARERSRLEDWPLLLLRSALIVALAVLGATPLVRCDRLSLARASGASVALSLVLDDSLSMRARLSSDSSRWEAAKRGAEQLLRSARDGDSVTIVLAGHPARIALAPTTDLAGARRILDELSPSDRATDLAAAVQLARSAVRGLPQRDRRVVVLSDLASDPIPAGDPPATTPLPELTRVVDDCGITSAERRGSRITARVACSSESAAHGRGVEAVVAPGGPKPRDAGGAEKAVGDVVGQGDLSPRRGEQAIGFETQVSGTPLDVRLTGKDAEDHDDRAPVSDESSSPGIGVVADPATASAKTGGPTVLEQALSALEDGVSVRPLAAVPDDTKALSGLGALVVDDPRGFSPEARRALSGFLSRGGVAVALLGRRSSSPELGSTLEPFAGGAARWEPSPGLGIDPSSAPLLGPEAASLGGIARTGRVRLDGMAVEGARVVAKWTDGVPFLLERRVGRGLSVTVGLPAALDESNLALRPGFLSLLDYVARQADVRSGARRTAPGTAWTFPDAREVRVEGPEGPLRVTREGVDAPCVEGAEGACSKEVLRAAPAVRGRYTVRVDGEVESRHVVLEPAEILAAPRTPQPISSTQTSERGELEAASREVAWLLVVLFAAELGLRLARRFTARGQKGRGDPARVT